VIATSIDERRAGLIAQRRSRYHSLPAKAQDIFKDERPHQLQMRLRKGCGRWHRAIRGDTGPKCMRGHGAAGPMSCWAAGELGCWVDGPLGCWVTGRKVRGAKVQTRRGATNEERGRHLRQRVAVNIFAQKRNLTNDGSIPARKPA